MKLSEAIEKFRFMLEEHGDIELGAINHEYGSCHVAEFELAISNRVSERIKECRDEDALGDTFVRVS